MHVKIGQWLSFSSLALKSEFLWQFEFVVNLKKLHGNIAGGQTCPPATTDALRPFIFVFTRVLTRQLKDEAIIKSSKALV